MSQQISFMGGLVALVLVFSVIEMFVPGQKHLARRKQHMLPNLALMILTLGLGILLNVGAVVFAAAVHINEFGLIKIELPFWAMLLISLFILDFSAYVAHRLMHKFPYLWRVHKVHHTDQLVDASTAYRQHPIEGVWRFMFTIVPSWILGISPEMIVIYKGLSALFAILEHTNIQIHAPLDKLVSLMFVTPNMHKIHHSVNSTETDSNYGNILALHDRILRTFTPQRQISSIQYGLGGTGKDKPNSLFELLKMPLDAPQ